MYFLIGDDDLLNRYNTTWGKICSDIRNEFDSEPVCDKNFLKTKIKSHGDETTDFHDNEMSKVGSDHTCLAVTNVDSSRKKMKTIICNCF